MMMTKEEIPAHTDTKACNQREDQAVKDGSVDS